MSTYNRADQSIDLKRLWKQFFGKIWIIAVVIIVGVIVGALTYKVVTSMTNGEPKYRISNDYYITFNFDEFVNSADYYNAYTWDGILRDDPIVNPVMELLPEVSKEQILDSVKGEMLGDYRILTVHVTTTDAELTKKISDAYIAVLPGFAEEVDMLTKMEVWTSGDVYVLEENTRMPNAAFLGGLIAFVVSLFVILLWCAVDDRIYTESDWVSRYSDIPYFGVKGSDEAEVNLSHIIGSMEGYEEVVIGDFAFSVEAFDRLRAGKGAVLILNAHTDRGEQIDKVIFTLRKQDVKIAGVLLA